MFCPARDVVALIAQTLEVRTRRRNLGICVGVYRFWRDLGHAAGAFLAGVLADASGMASATGAIGVLTIASGLLVAARMPETLGSPPGGPPWPGTNELTPTPSRTAARGRSR